MGDDNKTGDFAEEIKPVYLGEDGEFYNPLIDSSTRANIDIDLNHHEIHEGDHFFIAEYITLASEATGNFVLEVGNKDLHFVFQVFSDIAGFLVQTYEGITASADGTIVISYNNCRPLKSKVSSAVLRYNPVTIGSVSGLVRLRNSKVGNGGNASTRVSGSLQRSDEVVLTRNTKYLLRITNLATSNNDITYAMSWYEKNVVVGA